MGLLTIRSPKGVEAPISTNDVSITKTLGNAQFDTITFTFLVNSDPLHELNSVGSQLCITPFSKVLCKGQWYYIQSRKLSSVSANGVQQYECTGIQEAKDLHRQYVRKRLHGKKADHYKLTLDECLQFLVGKTKKLAFVPESSIAKDNDPLISRDLTFFNGKKVSYPDGFGKGYADELLQKLAKDFGFEYYWDNYTCVFGKKIGLKDSFVFADSVNCEKIDSEIITSGMTTRVHVESNPKRTRKKATSRSKKRTKTVRESVKARKAHKKTTSTKKAKKTKKATKSTAKKTTKKKHSGPVYELKYDYSSPLIKKLGYPIIDAKPKKFKGHYSLKELKAKAKKLVTDTPKVTYTVTGANFKIYANPTGTVKKGNQGWLRPAVGQEIYTRVTSITEYPFDKTKEDTVTFGNVRLSAVGFIARTNKMMNEISDKMSSMSNNIYDLTSMINTTNDNFEDVLDIVDDVDSRATTNAKKIMESLSESKKKK